MGFQPVVLRTDMSEQYAACSIHRHRVKSKNQSIFRLKDYIQEDLYIVGFVCKAFSQDRMAEHEFQLLRIFSCFSLLVSLGLIRNRVVAISSLWSLCSTWNRAMQLAPRDGIIF